MSIVAIDVGLKRIGVAVLVAGVAVAGEPIIRKNRDQAAADVSEMLRKKSASKLIVGLPIGGEGEEEIKRDRYAEGLEGEAEFHCAKEENQGTEKFDQRVLNRDFFTAKRTFAAKKEP